MKQDVAVHEHTTAGAQRRLPASHGLCHFRRARARISSRVPKAAAFLRILHIQRGPEQSLLQQTFVMLVALFFLSRHIGLEKSAVAYFIQLSGGQLHHGSRRVFLAGGEPVALEFEK